MTTETIVALSTLAGVIISVLVSLFVSFRNTDTEFKKLKSEFQRGFAAKLIDKRLEVCPSLYSITSDFFKRSKKLDQPIPEIEIQILRDFLSNISEWDSKNSIFLSTHAIRQLSRLRYHLDKVITDAESQQLSIIGSGFVNYNKVLQDAEHVEFALRSDIAVYELDIANVASRIRSYDEQEKSIK